MRSRAALARWLAVGFLLTGSPVLAGEPPASAPPQGEDELERIFTPRSGPVDMAPFALRRLHSAGGLALRAFSSLDALVGAVDHGGRPETQAFWIGAASSLVPGSGQWINGDALTGGLMLFTAGLSASTLNALPPERSTRDEQIPTVLAYRTVSAVRDGLTTYAMLQAANTRYRNHRDRSASLWTGAASILPGVGQAINGEWWAAGGFLLAWALTAVAAADLESRLFTTRDLPGLLAEEDRTSWSHAWLPGGAVLGVRRTW